ncbi:MAG: RDD family protein [Candidatus Eisenbacteria bacterium]
MEEMEKKEGTEPTGATPPEKTEGAARPKADLTKRAIALVIDGVISGLLVGIFRFVPFLNLLLGAAYILLRDGLPIDFMAGRSLGKKIMKIRPVTQTGSPMDLATSAKRNWMFALPTALLFIPILGWILIPIVSVVITVVEIYLVVTTPDGRRWGDKFAGTQVIDSVE